MSSSLACPSCGQPLGGAEHPHGAGAVCPRCGQDTGIAMPAATTWPVVLALALAMLGVGVATSLALSAVGVVLLVVALTGWVSELLPGRGHVLEPRTPPSARPRPIEPAPGTVEAMREGRPGYRFWLPEKVHPISAGIKGGIVGGLVMPIPALLYGILSGHGIWWPINLLAGMVLPTTATLTEAQLEQFSPSALVVGVIIHAVLSVSFGLLYGVVLPMLPQIRGGPVLWGGILMPLLWTWLSHGLMGLTNPVLARHVDWPWFLVSQFVYGLAMSIVVYRSEKVHAEPVQTGPGAVLDRLADEGKGQR